jgi:hypothetical protein
VICGEIKAARLSELAKNQPSKVTLTNHVVAGNVVIFSCIFPAGRSRSGETTPVRDNPSRFAAGGRRRAGKRATNKQKEPQMNAPKKIQIVALAALSLVIATLCFAQSDAPYTEGPVWLVTMVRTKPGMGDDYLKSLAQTARLTNDEAKKQGIIMDYKILLGDASDPHDYNILIMQEVKNFAAYDGIREKIDPIAKKLIGNEDQQRQLAIKRIEVREILGTKRMREITLK